MIAALAMAVAVQATPAAPAGFVPMSPAPDLDPPATLCTPDRQWCITPPEPQDTNIYVERGTTGEPSYWSPPEGDGFAYVLSPYIAPLKAGGALVLMEAQSSTGYSGGGADFTNLVLIHVAPTGDMARVATVPGGASLLIRACFSEEDAAKRAGACHDEYEMNGTIALEDDGSALPPFRFTMQARAFPRGVRRDADSLTLPPLTKADLVWQTDETCTYRRTFTYSNAEKQYGPDAPLPDCSQYSPD